MPERDDPIANTQMFRAFLSGAESEPSNRRRQRAIMVAVTLAVAAVAALIAALLILR